MKGSWGVSRGQHTYAMCLLAFPLVGKVCAADLTDRLRPPRSGNICQESSNGLLTGEHHRAGFWLGSVHVHSQRQEGVSLSSKKCKHKR